MDPATPGNMINDLKGDFSSQTILQGDVGCGKTIIENVVCGSDKILLCNNKCDCILNCGVHFCTLFCNRSNELKLQAQLPVDPTFLNSLVNNIARQNSAKQEW